MNVKLIGIGAAGNKAAINAVENSVIAMDNVMLINSTLRDIPADYKGLKIEYAGAYRGCGKERGIAYDLAKNNLLEGNIPLEEFLCVNDPEKKAHLVVIVTSTEGGTGSGSSILIGQYIQSRFGIQVHMFGFAGFHTDPRGLKNTVEWFQGITPEFAVECIENSKFLPECRNNKLKAETAANVEFGKKLGILMGNPIRDSSHNIDETDLLKIVKTPGFTIIESANFEKVKNREQFEEIVINMIDESKSFDVADITSKRTAVIININAASTDYISYEDIIRERYGTSFENYLHIQHEADMPEFIAVIVAGIKMPAEQVQRVYNEYKTSNEQVDRVKDNFFASSQKLELDDDFDMVASENNTMSDEDFFASLSKKPVKKDKISEY